METATLPIASGPARRRDDAVALWSEQRLAVQQCLHDCTLSQPGQRPMRRRRLLLALEVMWKLEEHALLPALMEAAALPRGESAALAQELAQLRDLGGMLSDDDLEPARASVVLAALDGASSLRAMRLENVLDSAVRNRRVDGAALARDMDELLARWRWEVSTTGDLEDEEADPVGRPPR